MVVMVAMMATMAEMAAMAMTETHRYDHVSKRFDCLRQVLEHISV